jgi:ABC-2 type transport system ATP-binding protein
VLEIDGLTRRFGDVVALDGLSFSVEPGRLFGFVGANGAGKTTAMRIVVGVERADAGEVRWQGRPITAEDRRRFGYMPEERGMYPKMAAARQLAYFARLHGADAEAAERAAHGWLERLGLAGRAGDNVEDLSLGNQQRVQMAAALVHDPDLLVLDEPFSGLDPIGTDALADILHEQAARGVPVIFSSHQLELVERICDGVAIINEGRLVSTGGVEELRDERGGDLWFVEFDGLEADWSPDLPGARVRAQENGRVVIELDTGDSQALLDAARHAGRVTAFGRHRPTLAALYREVVVAGAKAGP